MPGMPQPIDVVELSHDLEQDYFALFDAAFRDNAEWDGCYCAFHDDTSGRPWRNHEDAAEHRLERANRIRTGDAHGLLAYVDGHPIGWCNVAPRSTLPNLRAFAQAVDDPADDPAVIVCFVIDPDWRQQGVASALVQGAIEASRRWGAPWLEAYPPQSADPEEPWTSAYYTGPLGMYQKAGFEVVRELGFGYVVRHDLALPEADQEQ